MHVNFWQNINNRTEDMLLVARSWKCYLQKTSAHKLEIETVDKKKNTWESVTLKTRFQGKRKDDASPKTRVETYINFWNACTGEQ
jgi:hypothetical protein